MSTMRKYETPKLLKLEDASKATLGNASGGALDAAFPVGTPSNLLTFS